MKKTLSTLLVFAFLALPAVGVAAAEHTADPQIRDDHPDCEEEAHQPGIGWELIANDSTQRTCEGEHWDGQDYYTQGDENTDTQSGLGSCTGATTADSYTVVSVLQCSDPAGQGGLPGARVSTGDGESAQYAYVAFEIALVGEAAVFTEGTTAAVYLKDHTVGDVLATAVSAARLTRGEAANNDCTYDQYEEAATTGNGGACPRDNTAITVTLLP